MKEKILYQFSKIAISIFLKCAVGGELKSRKNSKYFIVTHPTLSYSLRIGYLYSHILIFIRLTKEKVCLLT